MENVRLTKTVKSESYEIELDDLTFATANNKQEILEPLLDRFETYPLVEYTDDEFREIAFQRRKQEGINDEQVSLTLQVRY
jgi:MoxR-like ATPase